MMIRTGIIRAKLPSFLGTAGLSSDASAAGNIVALQEVQDFITRCMTAAGTKHSHAVALADNLSMADYRGHYSHGLNRLDMYVNDIRTGVTVSGTEPSLLRETAATAHVDGGNLLGPVVGNFCMQTAIKKAKQVGVGWVVANNSNHFGIAGAYALQASKQGLLGMAFTNTSPLVVPTRARNPAQGTNPISLMAPAVNGDSFELDMATSSVSIGKVELANVRQEDIPSGWGADAKGKETHNPKAVLDGGGLLPLGGSEISGGYKGYGLGLMVEIFCGILAGAQFGPNIRKWRSSHEVANLGQCFIAVDPNSFAPDFENRLQVMLDQFRSQDTAEGEVTVLIPGDPEKSHMLKCDRQGGIAYHQNQINLMNELATSLKVPQIKLKS